MDNFTDYMCKEAEELRKKTQEAINQIEEEMREDDKLI